MNCVKHILNFKLWLLYIFIVDFHAEIFLVLVLVFSNPSYLLPNWNVQIFHLSLKTGSMTLESVSSTFFIWNFYEFVPVLFFKKILFSFIQASAYSVVFICRNNLYLGWKHLPSPNILIHSDILRQPQLKFLVWDLKALSILTCRQLGCGASRTKPSGTSANVWASVSPPPHSAAP